jgi:hypothetical protein
VRAATGQRVAADTLLWTKSERERSSVGKLNFIYAIASGERHFRMRRAYMHAARRVISALLIDFIIYLYIGRFLRPRSRRDNQLIATNEEKANNV